MITQLDNTLEPLLEKSCQAIGFSPSVNIHYVDKDHVDVYITGYNIRVSHTYNSLLEGIEKQFVEFISEVQEIMRRESSQYRSINEIFNEIDDIFDEPDHVNESPIEPIEIDWRRLEW